jgi:hypothetical protein
MERTCRLRLGIRKLGILDLDFLKLDLWELCFGLAWGREGPFQGRMNDSEVELLQYLLSRRRKVPVSGPFNARTGV